MTRRHELAWCLLGPDLLHPNPLPLLSGLADWVSSCPDALLNEHFATLPEQLGRRFERHWAWILGSQPAYTVHATDFQIVSEGRTLGAPDLLLSCDGESWHVELAVKFYLCRPDKDGLTCADWIGPRGNDRLDRKLNRLQEHQLPLLQRPSVQRWLIARNLPIPTRQAVVLKGMLFSHWQQPTDGPGRCRPVGWWCRVGELCEALPGARILDRRMWLGDTETAPYRCGASLVSAVEDAIRVSGPVQLESEHSRWFVVPNDWP